MFKNNTVLKNEVLRYFTEHALVHLEIMSNTLKDVLKEYKDEEKIEAINKLTKHFAENTNGFAKAFEDLDALCNRENTVFSTSGDIEEAGQIFNLGINLNKFKKSIEVLVDNNPENKNDIILLQAQKINLFDNIFKETMDGEDVPDYCYHFYDFTLPEKEGDVIPGQKGYLLTPIVELHDYLQFN